MGTQGDYAFYDEDGENFALTFTSTLNESFTTYPIYLHADPQRLSKQIELALKSLPNRVITDVEVNTNMAWIGRSVNGSYFKKRSYDGDEYHIQWCSKGTSKFNHYRGEGMQRWLYSEI